MKRQFGWLALIFSCISLNAQVTEPAAPLRPKNIVLMIGDGMGVSQITAGLIANDNTLNLERFRHLGFIKTFSADDLITDSAAGATAFASGKKTNNGYLGLDPKERRLPTIAEIAHASGLATGLVATSTVQHATPAAFYAHNIRRDDYEGISLDLVNGAIDLAIGGGKFHMMKRSDKRNLLEEMRAKGYYIADNLEVATVYNKVPMMVLMENGHMPAIMGKRGDYLPNAASLATQLLSADPDGFFLMIEGSQIDWAGHANDPNMLIQEMVDFDQAIGSVLDFAELNKETLVIVTADHETGGFSIEGGSLKKKTVEADFTTDRHTADLIPVFAFGPGAEQFTGIYDNTEIFHRMMKLLQLSVKPE
jgi:alkaline phosphatase